MSAGDDALDAREIEQLERPAAHPHDASASAGIEHVQTHISRVFLTADRVYKLRKPVDLGFVDFTTRAARNADCIRELALNRRLAPDVYLGLAPLLRQHGRVTVGELSERELPGAEHCVVMRRLAAGRDALSLLQRGELGDARLSRVAAVIAELHARERLGRPAPWTSDEWIARIARRVEDNFSVLADAEQAHVEQGDVARAARVARGYLQAHRADFERRRSEGRAVDGHGDLHLAHVWFERDDDEPTVIDCVEFSDELRRIDAAADVAFLAMDLRYRGAELLAENFLSTYAELADDHDLYSVVDYYVAYRAGVRAKVAALAARDAGVPADQRELAAQSARKHLQLAALALERSTKGAVVVMCGIVGTGKSTVARQLAGELGAVRISSDQLRSRLHARLATDERYAREARLEVYRELLERARAVLRSGRIAVLDATFESRALRERAVACARELGAEAWLVETIAEPAVVKARLAARSARGRDASEAGPGQWAGSVERFERTDEWGADRKVCIATDARDWHDAVRDLAARIAEEREEPSLGT